MLTCWKSHIRPYCNGLTRSTPPTKERVTVRPGETIVSTGVVKRGDREYNTYNNTGAWLPWHVLYCSEAGFFFLLRAVEKDVGCLASESVSRINQSADQAIDAPATDCSAKCANAVGTTATRHTCCMKGTPIANHTGHWIDSGSRCAGCPTCLARIIATVICLEWA